MGPVRNTEEETVSQEHYRWRDRSLQDSVNLLWNAIFLLTQKFAEEKDLSIVD